MNGSALTTDNARAYNALITGIFSTLVEYVLAATINNEE